MATLQISLPDGTKASYELLEEKITIGRVPDNTIEIEDPSVSSHHAELVREGEHFVLRDLDSTNGTRLNGHSHKEGRIKDGDEIEFGKVRAGFVVSVAGEARPMPEESAVELQPAEESARPSNFENASPFQSKAKKKDPVAAVLYAFAGVAILVFLFAVLSILNLKAS